MCAEGVVIVEKKEEEVVVVDVMVMERWGDRKSSARVPKAGEGQDGRQMRTKASALTALHKLFPMVSFSFCEWITTSRLLFLPLL